ncbi:MAG: replication endonuclease [Cellvibrio sp.]|jgi:hypothetical protein|uniref:replication endonuclease n=1 Tax=Cellvibrio sp. TaxID=1965322 RepID=UPI002715FB7C|nr:replication endonuclease [Cellvibrio sp.]
MQHYALQTDGDEPGAQQYRFKAIPIDKSKGSAVGYIANTFQKTLTATALNRI